MFKIDTKDLKTLTDNLRKCSKSAYPLTVRSTLNRMAFETSNTAKKDVLPKVFTLRNKYIQSTVGYKRCDNTFNIASMSSYAGQVSEWKGKPTGQLEKQEYGKPVFAKGKHTFVATPTARGGSYNKTILRSMQFSRLDVKKLSDFVENPTHETHKEIRQSKAFAISKGKQVNVLLSNAKGKKGIYTVSKKSVKLLYRLNERKTDIDRTQCLKTAADKTIAKAEEFYVSEAVKRFEKVMMAGLQKR